MKKSICNHKECGDTCKHKVDFASLKKSIDQKKKITDNNKPVYKND